jgi:hypothetical protein
LFGCIGRLVDFGGHVNPLSNGCAKDRQRSEPAFFAYLSRSSALGSAPSPCLLATFGSRRAADAGTRCRSGASAGRSVGPPRAYRVPLPAPLPSPTARPPPDPSATGRYALTVPPRFSARSIVHSWTTLRLPHRPPRRPRSDAGSRRPASAPLPHGRDDGGVVRVPERQGHQGPVFTHSPADEDGILELQDVVGSGLAESDLNSCPSPLTSPGEPASARGRLIKVTVSPGISGGRGSIMVNAAVAVTPDNPRRNDCIQAHGRPSGHGGPPTLLDRWAP